MSVSKSATRAAATSVRAGDGGLRSFAASAEGSLPTPRAAALAPTEDLLGPRAVGLVAGDGLLLPGAADFAPPRLLRFAERVPDPSDRPALPRRVLTIPLHHYQYNSSNIPPIRKNLQLTRHTRRKYVFTGRAGDRNVPWPLTPGNLQHSRRRLPELGRRHPSPTAAQVPINSTAKRSETPPIPPMQYLFFSS
jgi:hypothetical protein